MGSEKQQGEKSSEDNGRGKKVKKGELNTPRSREELWRGSNEREKRGDMIGLQESKKKPTRRRQL